MNRLNYKANLYYLIAGEEKEAIKRKNKEKREAYKSYCRTF